MNRRQFFTAGLALAGCTAHPSSPPLPPGDLLGPDLNLGHRLRDGGFAAPVEQRRVDVAIIGAGIAGLSAAWWLDRSQAGDYQILEAEAQPGGNARWGENAVSTHPWGAHYLPLPSSEAHSLRLLLADLQVLRGDPQAARADFDERYLCHTPQERLFQRGHWQEGLQPKLGASQRDLEQYRRFDERMAQFRRLRGNDGRRVFALPLSQASRDPQWWALDRITMRQWLAQEQFDSPGLLWLVDYACRDDFGTRAGETSAWAGIHYFACRDGEASHAEPGAVLTWPEGNGWIARRLAARCGARLQPRQAVWRVDAEQQRLAVWDAATGHSYWLQARQVIWAAPLFLLPRVWPKLPGAWGKAIAGVSHAPWLVANFTLDQLPQTGRGAPLAWDNVLYGTAGLGYVVATHQALRGRPGATVITYYRALADADPAAWRRSLLTTSRESWVRDIFAELAPAHPELPHITRRADIWRWGHGMPRLLPGVLSQPERPALKQGSNWLHLAHSEVSGMSLLEEAHDNGVAAAQWVLKG